jgi:Asp/Glu/hydantoin racemase
MQHMAFRTWVVRVASSISMRIGIATADQFLRFVLQRKVRSAALRATCSEASSVTVGTVAVDPHRRSIPCESTCV